MNNKIKNKIIDLSKKINYYNYRYYIINKPLIENYKYDKLLKKLIILEKKYNYYYKNSPTKSLNNNLFKKKFLIIKHYFKMFTIKNVYNKKNLILWKNKIEKKINKKTNYICEFKYDGIAISIIYKYGKIKNAITRGNGKSGNEVINNVINIRNIPKYINKIKNIKFFDIKGEIVISKKNFIIINNYKKKNKKKIFSHPRNAVNGIIHTKTKKNNKLIKYLTFIPYYIYTKNKNFLIKINNQLKSIKYLEYLNFKFQKKSYKICNNEKEILKYIGYWEKNINKSLYPIDGIVIKINSFKLKNKLKNNNIFYKWCIAYKFKEKKYITKVKKIIFLIGKSGIIVPVVNFKNIIIDGTIIKKATLYNSNIFEKYNLSINDKIVIIKSGNIIPKIIKNLNNKKYYNYKNINFPLYCPCCNIFLEKKNKILYCKNENCNIKRIEKIKYFIKIMNIKINKNIINKLLLNNKLKNITYIYKLKIKDLLLINVTKKESIRIINEIKDSKNNKYYKILLSLNIPGIGKYIIYKIKNKYNNIKELLYDIKNNIINILNKNNINNIKTYFKKNINIIKKLRKIGLKI
ncbi:MAG: DNA ligase [Flavobacteriales endosymbiont of Rhyzopertha dominica]|nr:MAG: NAD-dependent DNA ligase LigA [Candidatus Shikimatogenerans bostrichidophilus]